MFIFYVVLLLSVSKEKSNSIVTYVKKHRTHRVSLWWFPTLNTFNYVWSVLVISTGKIVTIMEVMRVILLQLQYFFVNPIFTEHSGYPRFVKLFFFLFFDVGCGDIFVLKTWAG